MLLAYVSNYLTTTRQSILYLVFNSEILQWFSMLAMFPFLNIGYMVGVFQFLKISLLSHILPINCYMLLYILLYVHFLRRFVGFKTVNDHIISSRLSFNNSSCIVSYIIYSYILLRFTS